MKQLVLSLLLNFMFLSVFAQDDFFTRELLNLGDFSKLPAYRDGDVEQLSSYDRTGGNDDGFSGKYSAIREESGGLVIADLVGPGVVNRIWTPTPTTDTIRFFFDGERKPRIALRFIDLFTGKQFPFLEPLCGNQIGGYYCYLPITYAKSLKIVFSGKNIRFHQTQFRKLKREDNVMSYTPELIRSHQNILRDVSSVWSRERAPMQQYGMEMKSSKINLVLRSGEEQTLWSSNKGGRILGIELDKGNLTQLYRQIMLSANWDGEPIKAIDLPLHDFFGFAFGKQAMQSILIGTGTKGMYSFIPMPFDKSADLKLLYNKSEKGQDEVTVTGTLYYTELKRDPVKEGKFYVQSRRQYNLPSGVPHTIADIKGKGHYVGTILQSQGLEEGHTGFFEGDDAATIDGKLKLHGTGSEDYFNGGWYAVMDRWDRGMSLPIHGSLEYDLMTARTGGYRFYLTDKLNFNQSFSLTIEHQPEAKNNVQADYTSLGMFYAAEPQFANTPILLDDKVVKRISHRNKLSAQGMVYSLYWLANAKYDDPSIVFSMDKSEAWFATIEPEAVPMAQIFIGKLDNGKYKLYVEYALEGNSGPFSVWQRSRQVSDWQTESGNKNAPVKIYAGEIEVTEDIKTITLRKKSPNTSVRIFSLIFERAD